MMKGVVFDLDGTLVNSIKDIQSAINYARKCFDGEPISVDETKSVVGSGLFNALKESVIKYGPKLENEDELELMFQLLMQYYKNHPAVYTHPYDGIIPLLDELKRNNIKVAILSNKDEEILKKVVPSLFGSYHFDLIIGSGTSLPKKPDKASLEYVLDKLGINKDELLYIGDSEIDYQTAINAGVKCLIVTYGFRKKEELEKKGVKPLFDTVPTYEDLLKYEK